MLEAGTFSGSNYASSPFNLDVVLATPIPLEGIDGFTQDFLDEAAGINFQIMSIVAIAWSEHGQLGLTGLAYHGVINSVHQARLLITSVEDLSQPVFETVSPSSPAPPVQFLGEHEIRAIASAELPVEYMTVIDVLEPSADCAHCYSQYQQDLQDAEDTFQQAVQQAEDQYQQAIASAADTRNQQLQTCNNNYADAKAAADSALITNLLLCHGVLILGMAVCATLGLTPLSWFTLGVAAALCIAAAHAAYAHCTFNAISGHTTAINTAKQIRDLCIANAHLAYQVAVTAAENTKLMQIFAALLAKLAAISAAQAARDACLAACEGEGGDRNETTAIRRVNLIDLAVEAMR